MSRTLTRRGFLQAAASTAALTLLHLRCSGAAESALPDAALGLAMAQVMIAENLHDESFIRAQRGVG